MTVFVTPHKKPFFAGTYFPRENRGQHAGFLTICRQIAHLWRSNREEIESSADEFAQGLAEAISRESPFSAVSLSEAFLADGVKALRSSFDKVHGGFSGAPKFPPHSTIEFLLRFSSLETADQQLREDALEMATLTLREIALGGIRDHVGGGFHRYSTDGEWHLPHFE